MLYVIRGLPGSGKTYLARMLLAARSGYGIVHAEADMDFTDKDGNYNFEGALLKEAHEWCLQQFKDNILKRDVIVSNTFTTQKEVQPYFNFCFKHNIPIQVIECHGQFGSVHNVPLTTITKMMERWESLIIPRIYA